MKTFQQTIDDHLAVIRDLAAVESAVEAAAGLLAEALAAGGKVLLCGNGGSAADAQHIAAELVVRFVDHRRPLSALALTTDSSILTAHSNDYEFASVFSRQVEALGRAGDVLVAISTSGDSANVVRAAESARDAGMKVVALTGAAGGALAAAADVTVKVPSSETARIQEAHILVGHWWCRRLEAEVAR